ncbi:MAG TPA: hypothetical protein PKK00_12245 [Bacteroidales bacterium]|nr:hypothetical protein [Bacteroidales bacterium]HPS17820.1 hypothetical protein [Bacteroidales bacterium]
MEKFKNRLKKNWLELLISLSGYLFIDYSQKNTIFNTMNWESLIISILFATIIGFSVRQIVKKEYSHLMEKDRKEYILSKEILGKFIEYKYNTIKTEEDKEKFLKDILYCSYNDIKKLKDFNIDDKILKEINELNYKNHKFDARLDF